ncbi:disease resistance protein RPV1-like [Rutidosis leptorrhynchoides]|uniref:disease resistance protein RPV1-like n=1 Tax=Rutidosis leptorrhynchoides TaxID=125765 RepID=UPI003A98F47B
MGGIGKTSLANYIYQMNHCDFLRSSFIEDIERRCMPKVSSLLDLQKQLLEDIQKGNLQNLNNVNVCTAKIEKALRSNQTFIILDGVDSFEQLYVLIGSKGFHPGSKIIITTKDGCIEPEDGYKEVPMKVVKHCRGHPLALKVLGSSLCNEDVVFWEDTVELLENEVNPTIQKDKDITETVLKECGVRTISGFRKLINRCLIVVGPRNGLVMHQLVQDIGRYLVYQESPGKPWKRSRIWRQDESYNVLKQEKDTSKIQGLVLDMQMMEKDASHGQGSSSEKIFGDDLFGKFGAHHLI